MKKDLFCMKEHEVQFERDPLQEAQLLRQETKLADDG
jgi:hypothetical protein